MRTPYPSITEVRAFAFDIPTETPRESDGTMTWSKTTLVVVEVTGGGATGLGFSYASTAAAQLVNEVLAQAIKRKCVMDIEHSWLAMIRSVRNLGRPGAASQAISAVDNALWDLKAKVLGLPLVKLLGQTRERIPVYGSGGFTSYTLDQLSAQLGGWVEEGILRVKMKVGREPARDLERVTRAREAIGAEADLYVDANGAYDRKQALRLAELFAERNVRWFEEPVSSDDLEGLRLIRDRAPACMDIAAGEYGYDPGYFRVMLEAGAVDVMQIDATRCMGITGFLKATALCFARNLPYSAHTAPSLHAHLCCASPHARHLEYFFDHVRIERLVFDGALSPHQGSLIPDLREPGLGLVLKRQDLARYAA